MKIYIPYHDLQNRIMMRTLGYKYSLYDFYVIKDGIRVVGYDVPIHEVDAIKEALKANALKIERSK